MLTVKKRVPLAPLTTFHIGGQADYFIETSGALELAEAFEYAQAHHLSVRILGGGSNVIFPDAGYRGLIIRILDGGVQISGERVSCGAGMVLFDVVRKVAAAGLAGIEHLAGIPGSFGGAIRGNAGAFGTEIGDRVTAVKVFIQTTGMIKEYKHPDCAFAYRTSVFKDNPELIILSAEMRLTEGDREQLQKIIEETVAKREAKHPQDAKCAGSFFINPVVKDEKLREEFEKDTKMSVRGETLPAGWLIDHVGLRGKKIGGAMVSDKHPNYLVNTGLATAEDVMMLASLVKTRVRDELGVQLRAEVQFVGF